MKRVATVACAACLAVLAAGCSSGPKRSHVAELGTTAPGTPAHVTGALAFARCVRSNGVARYPDPGAGGPAKPTLQQLAVSSSRFQSAVSACRHLLPNGGQPPDEARRQQIRVQALSFSQCIRAHGVPGFPDPGSDGRIPDPATGGIDQGSPKFQTANRICGRYRPPYMPSNAAYNLWARTNGGS